MILLAWGRNLMGFTEFAFKYLPGYNKFRTVSMTLVVVQWAVPLLGALALMRLWKGEIPRERLLRALAWAAGITGGACLLLAVAGGSLFDFGRAESADYMTDTFRHIFESNNMRSYIDRGMDIEWGRSDGRRDGRRPRGDDADRRMAFARDDPGWRRAAWRCSPCAGSTDTY